MRIFRVFFLLSVAFLLVFSLGCAARETVKKDAVPEPTSQALVEDSTPVATPVPQGMKYVVKKGDTLWEISSNGRIYQDPFQWPVLYKANRDQITDPDIIEVGQELDVRKDLSTEEVSDAIQKAKDTPPYKPHTAPRKTLPLKY